MPLPGAHAAGPTRRVLGLALALALVGCQGSCPPRARPLGHPPGFGHRVLVLAPHPDDEVLGAAGLLAETLRHGGRARVIVATDGAAGGRGERAGQLTATRESETRRALGRLGLGAGDVAFLGYADGGLARAWSERWQVAHSDMGDVSATRLVDALHAALRAFEPETVVLPMPLDRHPDHAALGRLAMLAMLEESGEPDLLAASWCTRAARCRARGRESIVRQVGSRSTCRGRPAVWTWRAGADFACATSKPRRSRSGS